MFWKMSTYQKFVNKLRLKRMLVWRILRTFRVVVFLVFYAGASASYSRSDQGQHLRAPRRGRYRHVWAPGVYRCSRCGAALYSSEAKWDGPCVWPSFRAALEIHEDPVAESSAGEKAQREG